MELLSVIDLASCDKEKTESLLRRSEVRVDLVLQQVKKIVSEVRRNRDKALLKHTLRLDGAKLGSKELEVSDHDFRLAYDLVDDATVEAIGRTAAAIRKFHSRQLTKQWTEELTPGARVGQIVRPLDSVGVYVPGGVARYPSSLLMAAVPARVAGVRNVVICTPPGRDGKVDAAVLVAARISGVDHVFKAGGAQAIAAMAYGTETIPRVDKIVGPGNIYVVAAKQVVSADVGVDFAAGPSEILIVADDEAEPRFVAADLLAQAEHDVNAAAVLVTTSRELAQKVRQAVIEMLRGSLSRNTALKSLKRFGKIVLAEDLERAIEFANAYAPEHLELMVRRPNQLLKRVKNAGSIFLGDFSPVAAGDLAVGPNHILPTGGAARLRSGLSVLDFVRLPTVQELSKEGLRRIAKVVECMADAESLPEHARSVRERLKEV